jgi:hypothetical protein
MTSMTPDWTPAASRCASAPLLMRTKHRRSNPGLSDPSGSVALTCLVQKCPCGVAETPDSEVALSIDSVPTDCATHRWYGIRLARFRPTQMSIENQCELMSSIGRLPRWHFAPVVIL